MASSFSTSAPTPVTDSHRRQPLHCPRCNSSNTKFCYYNNYSLSQPRHYCKACKRYWTRGGTLRNVPVGGGCRQNKKLKRPPLTAGGASRSSPPSAHGVYNPLIYGLQTSNNLLQQQPTSRFSSSAGVRFDNPGLDFQLEASEFGLGFSSGTPFGSSVPPFSSAAGNNSALYGSSGFSSSSAMAASLLASSTFQPQKKGTNGNFKDVISNVSSSSMPSEGEQMASHHRKDVKAGESGLNNPNPIDHLISSDPSSLLWTTTNLGVGAWLDPSNSILGSSISSMI